MRKEKHRASDILHVLDRVQQKPKIRMRASPAGAHALFRLLSLQNRCIHFTVSTGRDGEGGIRQRRGAPKATGSNAGQGRAGSVR